MTGTVDTVKVYGYTREEIERARRKLARLWHCSTDQVTDGEAADFLYDGKPDAAKGKE